MTDTLSARTRPRPENWTGRQKQTAPRGRRGLQPEGRSGDRPPPAVLEQEVHFHFLIPYWHLRKSLCREVSSCWADRSNKALRGPFPVSLTLSGALAVLASQLARSDEAGNTKHLRAATML